MGIKFDLQKAVHRINDEDAKLVLIQVPEGIKTKVLGFIEELKTKCEGTEFVLMVDPLFGACDINEKILLEEFGADLIIHFGHNQFLGKQEKVVFLPGNYVVGKEFNALLKKVLKRLNELGIEKIALFSIIQFKNYLDETKKFFEKNKLTVLTVKGKRTAEGQTLGCDVFGLKRLNEKDFDVIVYLGDGSFHSSAIAMMTNKKIISVNPLSGEFAETEGEKEKFLKKRMGFVSKAMSARTFGLLVSTKKGQFRLTNALRLKKLIEKKGKKAFILSSDLLLPEFLIGLQIDCFVNTACPRMIDDSFKFDKPLINSFELEMVLGTKEMKNYDFTYDF